MIALILLLAALAIAGIVGALVSTANDGLRAIPTRDPQTGAATQWIR